MLLRAVVVALVLAGPAHAWAARRRARWRAGPLEPRRRVRVDAAAVRDRRARCRLIWFIWKTVEIRSTQSATGILYVQLFLVMAGELLAKYLRVAAGIAL